MEPKKPTPKPPNHAGPPPPPPPPKPHTVLGVELPEGDPISREALNDWIREKIDPIVLKQIQHIEQWNDSVKKYVERVEKEWNDPT